MAYTYPAPQTTLDGTLTVAQTHYLLKSPALLARRVRTLALNRYIGDFLLTDRYNMVGGVILYPNGEPLFTNDEPEAVGIGGEYPLTTLDAGTLAMAKALKTGRDVEIYDESIARMVVNPVNRALTKLVNMQVKYFDAVCLGVIASKVTATRAAGAAWTTGAQIVKDVLLTKAQVDELEDGFDLDTVVLKPIQYATVMAELIEANLLPREAANPLNTGEFPNYLGLTWTTTVHSPVTDPFLVDRQQLGGIGSEDLQSPDYSSAGNGIDVATWRLGGEANRDGYRVRARRNSVPVVVEPSAGIRITGTGI